MAPYANGAIAFYGALLGWMATSAQQPDMDYASSRSGVHRSAAFCADAFRRAYPELTQSSRRRTAKGGNHIIAPGVAQMLAKGATQLAL